MFIAALLTTGKTRKQRKCPSEISGLRDTEDKLMVTKKERGEGLNDNLGINTPSLIVKNKVLL